MKAADMAATLVIMLAFIALASVDMAINLYAHEVAASVHVTGCDRDSIDVVRVVMVSEARAWRAQRGECDEHRQDERRVGSPRAHVPSSFNEP
jgi:hypothetical protein